MIFNITEYKDQGSQQNVKAVRAREMYKGLELDPTHFSKWSKRIQSEYVENEDFVLLALDRKQRKQLNLPNNVSHDLILSLNTAKHEAMRSGSKKGKEVRQYFIDCENKYQQEQKSNQYSLPQTYKEALLQLAQSCDVIENQQKQINTYTASNDCMLVGDMAKILEVPPHVLFKVLRCKGHLVRNNAPSQRMIKSGIMAYRKHKDYNTVTPYFTAKGHKWILKYADDIRGSIESLDKW